jgi:DNA polymerase elongation subunit (family B)
MTSNNLVFHLLDLYARDQRIERETDEVREVVYESGDDDSDDEIMRRRRRGAMRNGNLQQRREFVIHLFGETADGTSVRADVVGFRPWFYLRLPEERTNDAVEAIRTYMASFRIPLSEVVMRREQHEKFFGFSARTRFPFLYMDFPSLAMWREAKNLFLDNKSSCPAVKRPLGGPYRPDESPEVFEANIDPMLRFIHVQNIQPCGWVTVEDGLEMAEEDESGVLMITCNYDCIDPCASPPRAVAPFLIASWDIECYSATGDFPIAKSNGNWKKIGKAIMGAVSAGISIQETLVRLVTDGAMTYVGKGARGQKAFQDTIQDPMFAQGTIDLITSGVTEGTATAFAERHLDGCVQPAGDPVIQIGVSLTRDCKTFDRHLFVWPSCAPCEGIVVHEAPTEKAMINAFFEWFVSVNPDVLLGYNVFGFDEKYLWERAEELGCITESSVVHGLNRLRDTGSDVKLEEKFLSSSALGDNFLYMWTTQGRLQIDLYHYIRRAAVLPSYKLDEVTKNYMSGKLKSYRIENEGRDLILEVAGAVKDIRPGRAICLLDGIGESVTGKLIVLDVSGGTLRVACPDDGDVVRELPDAQKWVVVKDDVSPQDIFRLHRGSAEDRATVGRYCIQDCDLVLELYKKLEVFNNAMSMANVCSVPISYIFVRGQGIKAESLIFKACRERDVLIPVLPAPRQPGDGGQEDSYEGAIVLDPEPGFYSASPIGVADFASLYPSTIESENISHDSLVWVKDFTYDGDLIAITHGSDEYDGCEGYGYTDIEFDIWRPDPADTRKHPVKIKVGRRICRYAQPLDGSKSTLPEIIRSLLAARKAKRKEAEKETDPERAALLDAEQLAYKLTGNSLYGQLGSGTFKVRLQHLAASVTAYGRKQILFAKAVIERFYADGRSQLNGEIVCDAKCNAKVVYGDSVTGDTPLLLTTNPNYDTPHFQPIETLVADHEWVSWHGDKEQFVLDQPIFIWTEEGWTRIKHVMRHKLAPQKKLYRVRTGAGYVDVTEDHSLILANGDVCKPSDISHGTKLLHSLPHRLTEDYIVDIIAHTKYDRTYAKVWEAKRWLFDNWKSWNLLVNDVLEIEELPHPGDAYVYDLETGNHHFAVGPGALIVHNTDSLFVEFNPRHADSGDRLAGRDARQAVIDLTAEAGHLVTQALKPPHDFEFDKIFDPMLMFSKKRYAGLMFENNADDYVHKYMGIALKRRDNAPIVKTIFGGAMKKLLIERDVVGATKLVKDLCAELVAGSVSLGQLTITKSLRADYADPSRIAHKALADRIAARDPGNAPASGDRIGFVYIRPKPGQEEAKLQGDRIELPSYVREKGLQPDYKFYIEHQIQNPVSQMFGILLDDMPGFDKRLLADCPTDPDRRIAWREAKAADLLFSEALQRSGAQTKRQFVERFFGTVVSSSSPAGGAGTGTVAQQRNRIIKPVASVGGGQKQQTVSNFVMDSYLVSVIKDKEREKKRKKAKEEDAGETAKPKGKSKK